MKSVRVNFESNNAKITFVPNHDGERVTAGCGHLFLIGGTVTIEEVPRHVGEDIEAGDIEAERDCLRPEGELGFHTIGMGSAYLGQVEGQEAKELFKITDATIFETLPENDF